MLILFVHTFFELVIFRRITLDGAFLYLSWLALIHNPISWNIHHILFGVMGFIFAGFTRFLTGMAFHWHPKIEQWHETYHDQLRRRIVYGHHRYRDDLGEVVTHIVFFLIVKCVTINSGFWIGLMTEFYFGFWIRAAVQYPKYLPKMITNMRFFRNAFCYYWYHIFVDPQKAWGFSCPHWDALVLRHPFYKEALLLPIPWLEFLVVKYPNAYYRSIQRRILRYKILNHV